MDFITLYIEVKYKHINKAVTKLMESLSTVLREKSSSYNPENAIQEGSAYIFTVGIIHLRIVFWKPRPTEHK